MNTKGRGKTPDNRALPVLQEALETTEADIVILFGSRARGDYHERDSDIDILLVETREPEADRKKAIANIAALAAEKAYGYPVAVQLVWRTLEQFRYNRRYVNSVETNAVKDGIIMSRNPENYSPHDYEDEETEYAYDWSNYDERLRHAETHLQLFLFLAENNQDDIGIGQHAQRALEHGMKALVEAVGGTYRRTHDIGELLGNVRHFDEGMGEFRLEIPPETYSEYEGESEYRRRKLPELSSYPNFKEKTEADARRIIERAKELRRLAD